MGIKITYNDVWWYQTALYKFEVLSDYDQLCSARRYLHQKVNRVDGMLQWEDVYMEEIVTYHDVWAYVDALNQFMVLDWNEWREAARMITTRASTSIKGHEQMWDTKYATS